MSGIASRVVARFQVQARYRPGDKVRILKTHNFKHYHGDVGVIEKIIPINKAYVDLEKNGDALVDLDDVEPVQDKSAAVDDALKEAAFSFLRESRFSWLTMGMAAEAQKSGERFGMRDAAKTLKAWFDGREPEGPKEEAGYRYIQGGAGQLLMKGLIKGVTQALKGTGARVGFKDVGEAIVAFAEDK